MNREEFLEYMDHFNNHRWDKVVSYFRPDVILEYPDNFAGPQIPGRTGRTLHGPEEFIENYKAIAASVREVLNLGAFMAEGNQFFVEFVTEFHAFGDLPEGSSKPWKKGEVSVFNQCVLYDVDEEGKFKRIRIFHHRHLDPSTAAQS
ncbi:MAG: nuclear transport factor 2 family protein [Dehalococcoidales bacterium]|nr:nuclear transport factor 2 family protein [Dehalococcoidales bacterium]